jgi:predicted enzyme related to lactoylglutathione lyase
VADKAKPTGPGTFCWMELMTTDTAKAGSFYTKLFGWTTEEMDMGEFVYTIFKKNDEMVGGMMNMMPGMEGVPSHWMSYVEVTGCDASTTQARELGAKVCKEPADIPNIGRFSIVTDPAGAAICLFEPKR